MFSWVSCSFPWLSFPFSVPEMMQGLPGSFNLPPSLHPLQCSDGGCDRAASHITVPKRTSKFGWPRDDDGVRGGRGTYPVKFVWASSIYDTHSSPNSGRDVLQNLRPSHAFLLLFLHSHSRSPIPTNRGTMSGGYLVERLTNLPCRWRDFTARRVAVIVQAK